MNGTTEEYVREDDHGVLRVGTTRVMLDSLLAGFQQGYSPETIQQQFPSLSLEEIYGAITYLNEHIVDGLLRREPAIEVVRIRDLDIVRFDRSVNSPRVDDFGSRSAPTTTRGRGPHSKVSRLALQGYT